MSTIAIKIYDWEASLAPGLGGNLFRLAWRGRELLRTPPSLAELAKKPIVYGIPVLFPPGRIDGGKFTFDGRDYYLPINEPERNTHLHGLVFSRPWEVTTYAADRVTLQVTYGETDPEFAGFPFAFVLQLEYGFAADRVIQTLTVQNCGLRPMPCGVGFHTVFAAPEKLRVWALDYRWEIPWPRCLATGKKLPWDTFDPRDWFSPGALDFSRQFPALPGVHSALLDYGGFTLCYQVDPLFRQWYLWNDHPQSGFIAVEPNSNVSGGFNLPLPSHETGIFAVEPGATVRLQSQFILRH